MINEAIKERRHVDDLTIDPRNARHHPRKSIAAIAASLERFGQQKPIVITSDGKVVAGNGRLAAARMLKWTHVGVEVIDDAQAAAFAIADNRTAELSEWNPEVLMAQAAALPIDLVAATGFSMDSLAEAFGDWRENAGGESDVTVSINRKTTVRLDAEGWALFDKARAIMKDDDLTSSETVILNACKRVTS